MNRWIKVLALVVAFVAIFLVSVDVAGHHSAPTTTTTSSTSTTSTTSTTVAAAACDAQGFSGVYDEGEGAAGTVYASVTLTKTSAGTCVLKGWPLLTLQGRQGALLTTTLVDVPSAGNGFQFLTPAAANSAPTSISMTAGSTTNFSLAYSDVPTGNAACESGVTLSVQFVANGPTVTVTPTYPVQPCDQGQLWVSPFY